MLIARAPVRISLAGGGTDLEAYYSKFGGAVVSASIDKYFYVLVSHSSSEDIQVSSSDYRTLFRHRMESPPPWDGDLGLPKAIIQHFGIRSGLSIFLASQVPPGTGLGSSSSVAVALIKAMAALAGRQLTRHEVAELACEIEIDRLGMPIGKQDQYAAAFGGLNYIEFRSDHVSVERLAVSEEVEFQLQRRLLLFFTGLAHNSAEILQEQRQNMCSQQRPTLGALHLIKDIAIDTRARLLRGDVPAVGDLLHESWLAKRTLASGISDPTIDRWYDLALSAGATGGKLVGAGGGGFLLLYCEPERQDAVSRQLDGEGLTRMDFAFESSGGTVIMNNLVGWRPVVIHV
jgi:D-glycero-alpha-D-manno-heptose-7-phosphate kinase